MNAVIHCSSLSHFLILTVKSYPGWLTEPCDREAASSSSSKQQQEEASSSKQQQQRRRRRHTRHVRYAHAKMHAHLAGHKIRIWFCCAALLNGMFCCGTRSCSTADGQQHSHSRMVPNPIASSTESLKPPAAPAADALEAAAAAVHCASLMLRMATALPAAALAMLLAVLALLLWGVDPSDSGPIIFRVRLMPASV
jgi:hypothetical protein